MTASPLPEPPKTLDVKRLADNLPENWSILRQLIGDMGAAHSARSDLIIAADLAGRLVEFQADRHNMSKELAEDTGIAFLFATVILYARATKSKSNHRKSFDLRAKMEPQELEAHRLICELRDDAIAHYGPGKIVAGMQIRDDHMFLVDGTQLLFASRNLAGSRSLAELIHRQTQRALLLMQRVHDQRESELIDYLNEHGDQFVRSGLWKSAMVDLVEAVGSEMAAQLNALPRVGKHRLSDSTS
jgi:hypothetical protein